MLSALSMLARMPVTTISCRTAGFVAFPESGRVPAVGLADDAPWGAGPGVLAQAGTAPAIARATAPDTSLDESFMVYSPSIRWCKGVAKTLKPLRFAAARPQERLQADEIFVYKYHCRVGGRKRNLII
jgi:hypothetical protein